MPRGTTITDEAKIQRRLWSPLSLSPAAWFDASDLSTITVATGVSNWKDKSGNGLNLTQATTSLQPSFSSSAVVFNGSKIFNDLTFPTFSALSVFFVGTHTLNGNRQVLFSVSGAYSEPPQWVYNATSNLMTTDDNNGPGVTATATFTGTNLLSLEQDKSNGQGYKQAIFANGSLNNSVNTILSSYPYGTTLSMFSWVVWGGNYNLYNGNVNELMFVTKTVSPADRQRVEGYLSWKWNLQAKLPASHPYVNKPPLLGV